MANWKKEVVQNNLRKWRLYRDYTLNELAQESNMSIATLRNYELHQTRLPLHKAVIFSKILRCEVRQLYQGKIETKASEDMF